VQLEPPANTYGPFPGIRLAARAKLFEGMDAHRRELAAALDPIEAAEIDSIQVELGASASAGHGQRKDQEGLFVHARFNPDPGGKILISGLRPDVAFTLEARDETGRVLASIELTLSAGERRRIALPYGE